MNDKNVNEDLLKSFDSSDMMKFLDFSANAAAYGYITSNAQDYVRNIEVAKLLKQKFDMFASVKDAQNWINQRMIVNPDNFDQVFRRLQGDGAGEVDFVRYINGSLKGLLYKAEYATDATGNVTNNIPAIDVIIRNRWSGEIVQQIQVKSNWSLDPKTLGKTIDRFLNNKNYDPDIVLVGPQELIDEAAKRGIPNPLKVFKSSEENLNSAMKLKEDLEVGNFTNTVFSINTINELGKGALIGGAVSLGVSSIQNYLALKNGDIDIDVAFSNIAKDSARGVVVGVALKGVALLSPPGLVGIGIGIIVGSGLKKIIDAALGKGDFEELVRDMRIDQSIISSYTNFATTTYNAFRTQRQFASIMNTHANTAALIEQIDQRLDIEIEKRLREI